MSHTRIIDFCEIFENASLSLQANHEHVVNADKSVTFPLRKKKGSITYGPEGFNFQFSKRVGSDYAYKWNLKFENDTIHIEHTESREDHRTKTNTVHTLCIQNKEVKPGQVSEVSYKKNVCNGCINTSPSLSPEPKDLPILLQESLYSDLTKLIYDSTADHQETMRYKYLYRFFSQITTDCSSLVNPNDHRQFPNDVARIISSYLK